MSDILALQAEQAGIRGVAMGCDTGGQRLG